MPVPAWEEATRALMPHERKDRSLLLHQEAVRRIQAEPVLADRALAILERWAQQGTGPTQLLRVRLFEIVENRDWAAVLEESERGRQLRQASPMPCLVPNDVRLRILRSLKDTGKPAGLDSLQEKYPLLFLAPGPGVGQAGLCCWTSFAQSCRPMPTLAVSSPGRSAPGKNGDDWTFGSSISILSWRA